MKKIPEERKEAILAKLSYQDHSRVQKHRPHRPLPECRSQSSLPNLTA